MTHMSGDVTNKLHKYDIPPTNAHTHTRPKNVSDFIPLACGTFAARELQHAIERICYITEAFGFRSVI